MSVHKKLMEARIRLQGMKLSKSGKNAYAGYEYFEFRRYLWVAAMEIVEHDALDATTSKETPRTKPVTVID